MNGGDNRLQHLSAAQVVDLLGMAIQTEGENESALAEYRRFATMPSSDLIRETDDVLARCGLEPGAADQLLGVSKNTVKRWLEGGCACSDAVKLRLAGLCVLLGLTDDDGACGESKRLADMAISLVRSGTGARKTTVTDELDETLVSVFGVSGLMAAALCFAAGVGAGGDLTDDGG